MTSKYNQPEYRALIPNPRHGRIYNITCVGPLLLGQVRQQFEFHSQYDERILGASAHPTARDVIYVG